MNADNKKETRISIGIFVAGYIRTIPEAEWESSAWPTTKKFNANSDFPLDERELRDIFDIEAQNIHDLLHRDTSEEEEKEIAKEFTTQKTKGTYRLAEYLCKKYNIITIGEKEREMYVYRDGMYFSAENEIIFPEIQRILGEHINKNAKSETYHKIADATSYPRSIFGSSPVNFIPVRNGVYDTQTKKLLPHSPSYKFMYQFPIVYDPKADCPKTKAFLKQILSDDEIGTFEEWLGYYFHRLYSFKKAMIFVGEGDTGKTTLLETIMNLLGPTNISSVSLHKMSSDKFSAAHLYRKHGNLVDELSAKDISDTGSFKMATGGGNINGEYKYGNQFSFLNFSKFTFACNKIPTVADVDDEAYFGRWIVIKFEKVIENKIPNFIATLTTEEERSGLFNLAMTGLERLLTNQKFSYTMSAVDIKTEMMKSGSSIAQFSVEGIEESADNEITKEDMYTAYTNFCASEGISHETKDMFGKKLRFYVKYVTEGLIYDPESRRGKRVRGWRNVALVKSEEDKKLDDKF